MTDLSMSKPLIGIYDEVERSVTVHQLVTVNEQSFGLDFMLPKHSESGQKLKYDTKEVGGYGTFKPIYKLENFRMTQHDVVLESGRDDFIYLARDNIIYKLYVDEEA